MTSKKLTQLLSAAVVCAFFSLSAACGGGNVVKDMESVADEMCACKDQACTAKVMEKAQKMREKYKGSKDPSEGDMEKIKASGAKMMGCMTKFGMPGAPK